MKKLKYMLLALVVLTMTVGCKKEVNVALNKSSIEISPEGEAVAVSLTSNGDWEVTSAPEWISISPSSGNGDATLQIVADANGTPESRSGVVTVTTKDNSASLTVTQGVRQGFVGLNPSTIECDFQGGVYEVAVTSVGDWTVSVQANWVSCSPMSGSKDGVVTVTVNSIEGEIHEFRETNVVFVCEGRETLLNVIQADMVQIPVQINPEQFLVDHTGAVKTVNVTCEGSWTAVSEADWMSVSANSGNGNAQVTVTIAPNEHYLPRNSYVNFISETGNRAILSVSQESIEYHLDVSPVSFQLGKEGGERTISITCNIDWRFDFDDTWLSVTPMEGTGNATATLTVAPNSIATPRTGSVTIKAGERVVDIVINQEAGDELPMAVVEPSILYPEYNGGFQHLELTSNVSWYLEASNWITLLTSSGTGNASFDILVDHNLQAETRTGYVNVMYNGQVLTTVVVEQEGMPDILETDYTVIDARPEGGEYTVHVTANQSWYVETSVEWLTCYNASGTNNGEFMVKVLPLMALQPRSTELRLYGSMGRMITITVNQSN